MNCCVGCFLITDYNLEHQYSWTEKVGLYEPFTGDIRSVLFTGIKKGVFREAKFDSKDGELTLARVLETDPDVLNWLRPHPQEFNITYNHGHSYEPDFVVETEDIIYLVEVKGEDKLKDPDVIAKKEISSVYSAQRRSDIDVFYAGNYEEMRPRYKQDSSMSWLMLVWFFFST